MILKNQDMNYANLTPDELKQITDNALQEASSLLERILRVTGERTVQNTFVPRNEISIKLSNVLSILEAMNSLHPDKEIRDVAETQIPRIEELSLSLSLNPSLYEAIATTNTEQADALAKRYKQHTIRDFELQGVNKDEDIRQKIQKLTQEITVLGLEFDRNIRQDRRILAFSQEELAGMPQTVIDRLPTDPETGLKQVSTDPSDYSAVLNFAQNEETRRRLTLLNNLRAEQNEVLLKKILEKRSKIAKLLGQENHATRQFVKVMVKDVKTVDDFLKKLDEITRQKSIEETQILLSRAFQDGLTGDKLHGWNAGYYTEVAKQEKFGYDARVMMPYFPYKQVETAILEIYGELFDIEFRRNTDFPIWHKDASCFDVLEDGELVGQTILDMHPRDGKYKHAAFSVLRPGIKNRQLPILYLMCNFPTGEKIENTLMDFWGVETFFHEFGHMLHGLFGSRYEWMAFSGIRTEWDFVEVPSQLMEMWLKDPQVLQRIGKHYETGESIPNNLIEKQIKSKSFNIATFVRRQMFLSRFALEIHTQNPQDLDLANLWHSLSEDLSPWQYTPEMKPWNTFGHLVGYDAMYYCYMWSLALVYDIMTAFDKNNMMDPVPAKRFRDLVLKQGGAVNATEMLQEFLGRPHSFDAFKNWLNS
jgi:thimet oligopeptidase